MKWMDKGPDSAYDELVATIKEIGKKCTVVTDEMYKGE